MCTVVLLFFQAVNNKSLNIIFFDMRIQILKYGCLKLEGATTKP